MSTLSVSDTARKNIICKLRKDGITSTLMVDPSGNGHVLKFCESSSSVGQCTFLCGLYNHEKPQQNIKLWSIKRFPAKFIIRKTSERTSYPPREQKKIACKGWYTNNVCSEGGYPKADQRKISCIICQTSLVYRPKLEALTGAHLVQYRIILFLVCSTFKSRWSRF